VDVTRGTPSGAAGTGTLGGAANFRTLDLDDVLAEGRGAGGLLRFGAGSNGKDWSGTLAGAQRVDTGQGRLGLLGAISGFQERPYKDGNGAPGTLTKGQQPLSYLLKAEYEAAGFGRLKFIASSYDNLFTPAVSSGYVWDVDQKIFALNYSRDDLRLNLSRVKSVIAQPDNAAGTGGVYAGREGVNTGTAFDLSDSAHLDFGGRPLTLSYGLAWNRDAFDGNAAAGGNADGTLTKSGLFVDARYEVGRLAVTGGLRYDHWKTEGVTDYLADGTPVALDARSGGKLNPSLRFDYQATPALNLHAALSGSMRPPTASEMFYPGGGLCPFGHQLHRNQQQPEPEPRRGGQCRNRAGMGFGAVLGCRGAVPEQDRQLCDLWPRYRRHAALGQYRRHHHDERAGA
jgi:hemoglobin/transferrin/lactoferrin receptor protein